MAKLMLDDCPANSDAYKTPHRAKQSLAKAKKAIGQTRVDGVRAGASALRRTVEEIIIRDLFKGTVKRWDEQVKIGNLKEIEWSNERSGSVCLNRHSRFISGILPLIKPLREAVSG
jgi:hypothetical protein